jgi:hypothetical protein
MKRAVSCLLVLALCMAPMSFTLAKDEDPPAVISFDLLTELIIAESTVYQKELQEIKKLELSYGELSRQLRDMENLIDSLPPDISSQFWGSASTLRANMRTVDTRIVELKDALETKVIQHVFPAQKMYMSHFILQIELEVSRLELEIYNRELENCRLKLPRGLCTARDLKNAEKNVDNQIDLIEAKEDSIDNNLKALAKYLGISSGISLGEMPEMDFSLITGRDLKADKEAYIAAAASLAEKMLDEAKKTYNSNRTTGNLYAIDIARQDFEKAQKDAESDFPKVYSDLLKAYNDFSDSSIVADAQEDYDKAVSQYANGIITRNMLLNSELMLEIVKERYGQQRIQLWLLFMDYEFSLVKLQY